MLEVLLKFLFPQIIPTRVDFMQQKEPMHTILQSGSQTLNPEPLFGWLTETGLLMAEARRCHCAPMES